MMLFFSGQMYSGSPHLPRHQHCSLWLKAVKPECLAARNQCLSYRVPGWRVVVFLVRPLTHDVCGVLRSICQRSLLWKMMKPWDVAGAAAGISPSGKLPPGPVQLALWASCLYSGCTACPTPITTALHVTSLHNPPDIALDIAFRSSMAQLAQGPHGCPIFYTHLIFPLAVQSSLGP